MTSSPVLRVTLAVLGLMALPDERRLDAGAQEHELVLVPGEGLATRYGLLVSDVPPPPLLPDRPARALGAACPVEVRAIVLAEPASESFAVLGIDRDSKIVRLGEGLRVRNGLLSVAAIEGSTVVLRHGETLVRCDLR